MIERIKKSFLQVTGVTSRDKAMSNSLIAALQHNLTYRNDISLARREGFRNAFAQKICVSADSYCNGGTEQDYLKTIAAISDDLSTQFVELLVNGRLRIGTTQKAFNLYMKFMWCLNPGWNTPPHCPIDRIVLQAVNIEKAWTKLDSIDLYNSWISTIRGVARKSGALNIAEWELRLWNQSVATV
jgi:hypothetical protein